MTYKKHEAFTLLEMLLVIAIIAVLSGIVIVAIDPARQLAKADNAQRASDIKTISNAIQQYYIDTRAWPSGDLSSDFIEVCATGDATNTDSLDCTGGIDLTALVPDYVPAIPQDSLTEGTSTKYAVALVDDDVQMVALESDTQDLPIVAIGTTTEGARSVIASLNHTGGDGDASSDFCVATGGTITEDGDYKVHKFLTGGEATLEVISGECEDVRILVVGGGGGGGNINSGTYSGGGGGAAGYSGGHGGRGIVVVRYRFQ